MAVELALLIPAVSPVGPKVTPLPKSVPCSVPLPHFVRRVPAFFPRESLNNWGLKTPWFNTRRSELLVSSCLRIDVQSWHTLVFPLYCLSPRLHNNYLSLPILFLCCFHILHRTYLTASCTARVKFIASFSCTKKNALPPSPFPLASYVNSGFSFSLTFY